MSFSLSEYPKIDIGWGFTPDPPGGVYSVPPDPLAGFKGAASRQDGNGGEGRMGREGKEEWGIRREKGEVGEIARWLFGGWPPLQSCS